jgi:hypothetical protein
MNLKRTALERVLSDFDRILEEYEMELFLRELKIAACSEKDFGQCQSMGNNTARTVLKNGNYYLEAYLSYKWPDAVLTLLIGVVDEESGLLIAARDICYKPNGAYFFLKLEDPATGECVFHSVYNPGNLGINVFGSRLFGDNYRVRLSRTADAN